MLNYLLEMEEWQVWTLSPAQEAERTTPWGKSKPKKCWHWRHHHVLLPVSFTIGSCTISFLFFAWVCMYFRTCSKWSTEQKIFLIPKEIVAVSAYIYWLSSWKASSGSKHLKASFLSNWKRGWKDLFRYFRIVFVSVTEHWNSNSTSQIKGVFEKRLELVLPAVLKGGEGWKEDRKDPVCVTKLMHQQHHFCSRS